MDEEKLSPDDKQVTAKAYLDYTEGRSNEYKVEFRQKTKDGSSKLDFVTWKNSSI